MNLTRSRAGWDNPYIFASRILTIQALDRVLHGRGRFTRFCTGFVRRPERHLLIRSAATAALS